MSRSCTCGVALTLYDYRNRATIFSIPPATMHLMNGRRYYAYDVTDLNYALSNTRSLHDVYSSPADRITDFPTLECQGKCRETPQKPLSDVGSPVY